MIKVLRQAKSHVRIIRNSAGLYFKDGTWVLDKSDATVFRTLQDALRARHKFRMENIIMTPPDSDDPPYYLN